MFQFNYCQLICMCHNLTKNNKIDRLHERCLRIPANIKEVDTIERFKSGIKKWKPESCPCRLCKTYIQQIGYM